MTALFDVRDVTLERGKGRKRRRVLGSYSLSIDEAEFVAVTGPSGCGKTTLLSSMEGFLRPSAGLVAFYGNDIYAMSSRELSLYRNSSIGMVFQFFNLIQPLTALDNAIMPAVLAGERRLDAERRANELFERVGILDKRHEKAGSLSGGEQQRVAIARALINNPHAILADEPTGNLDRTTARAVLELLVETSRERGIALVVVTHDEMVAEAADRVVCLAKV